MSSSLLKSQDIETKRRKNIEDNLRFLAALKISDIRDEIKERTGHANTEDVNNDQQKPIKKEESKPDKVRRGARIRKNIIQLENLSSDEEKTTKKKNDKNQNPVMPKIKLQLPEHMLVRYHSTGKKVALYNSKAKLGDDTNENMLI